MREAIARLQALLERRATAASRDWWTRYMKNVIPFRGVGIPVIRETLKVWRSGEGIDALPAEEQFDLALDLIREPVAEDKLAGVLLIQESLVDEIDWKQALPRYAALFDEGHIADWNLCDWFCVRVLGPTVQRHGLAAARAIGAWHSAENLWRARASAVAFVNLTGERRFHAIVVRSCTTLIRREERFAKTAVGWLMREISKHDPGRVRRFVAANRRHFSTESLRSASRFLEPGAGAATRQSRKRR